MHIFLKEKLYFFKHLPKNVTYLNIFFESCVFTSTVHQMKKEQPKWHNLLWWWGGGGGGGG